MLLMRAGVTLLAPLLLSVFAFGVAMAQQAAPASAPPILNVLVVDVQSLLQNSKSAKMVRQQIEQKRSEYAKEISQQEEALRRERDALQRQQASLSAEALNKVGTAYKVYSAIYPALRGWTLLDRLIPFSPGYMMVARASKTT